MKDKIPLIEAWIEKAEHDLDSAKLIFNHLPAYYDMICFHCQQAAEKYLKAYLIFLDIEFQKKHNLDYLLNLISQSEDIDEEIYKDAVKLDAFAVNIRYPDIIIMPSKEEIEEAIAIAEKCKQFAIVGIKIKK
jgi:HEPN domain-containing protein